MLTDLPVGISTFVLASPFDEKHFALFSDVKAMGYDLVEVCISDFDLSADALAAAATDAGLSLSISAVFGEGRDLSHSDPDQRAAGVTHLLDAVRFAAEVGARIVSGPLYGRPGRSPARSENKRVLQREWAAEGIRVAADVARNSGVVLAIEALNRFETDLVNTVAQALELCDLVDRDNVGLTLDTFHMNIEEKNLGDAIRVAGDRIFSFQASESDRGTPGTGLVDWSDAFAALVEINYHGPIVVESFRSDEPETARAVAIWRPVAESMDSLARESVRFVRQSLTH
ncbi:sugar phosphate isomerase/epimerase family protein [Microbacterium sp. A93]|uniref:sugar phosphate isomerase/epimerase family protein n=1 Tax=Microbacterium sp. A93 TaxID=3450716 RepID=UPI003F438F4B